MEISGLHTFFLGLLALILGRYLGNRIPFLKKYFIPNAVSGGLAFALAILAINQLLDQDLVFETKGRDLLLLLFFSCIGLSFRVSALAKGGKPVLYLSILAIIFLFLQNGLAIGLTSLFGKTPAWGLFAGSMGLMGGYGSVIAYSPLIENTFDLDHGLEVGMMAATIGLVCSTLIGGPIAKFLISRYKVKPKEESELLVGVKEEKLEDVSVESIFVVLTLVIFNIVIGLPISDHMSSLGYDAPDFLYVMIVGIIVTNLLPVLYPKRPWSVKSPTLGMVSDWSLGLFLSISLLSMDLTSLTDRAGIVIVVLICQIAFAIFYCIFVIYNFMGRDYKAVVMSAGFAGLSLGTVPSAILNMSAVEQNYAPSPTAIITVSIVGSAIIHFSNAVIIKLFIDVLG